MANGERYHQLFTDADYLERIFSRCLKESGCLNWAGCVTGAGYGYTSYRDKRYSVHRLVWLLTVGPPGDAEIRHRCASKVCVNPDHLWRKVRPVAKSVVLSQVHDVTCRTPSA